MQELRFDFESYYWLNCWSPFYM